MHNRCKLTCNREKSLYELKMCFIYCLQFKSQRKPYMCEHDCFANYTASMDQCFDSWERLFCFGWIKTLSYTQKFTSYRNCLDRTIHMITSYINGNMLFKNV